MSLEHVTRDQRKKMGKVQTTIKGFETHKNGHKHEQNKYKSGSVSTRKTAVILSLVVTN